MQRMTHQGAIRFGAALLAVCRQGRVDREVTIDPVARHRMRPAPVVSPTIVARFRAVTGLPGGYSAGANNTGSLASSQVRWLM
jgi:hypothetical protein